MAPFAFSFLFFIHINGYLLAVLQFCIKSSLKNQKIHNVVHSQSARLFLLSSELGPSHPQTSASPRPFGSGGTHSFAGEGVGAWGSQFGRGDRHCDILGHRLNMELDLQRLFGLLCTAELEFLKTLLGLGTD
jgi:hypothetical protein